MLLNIIRESKQLFRRKEVAIQAASRSLWGVSGIALFAIVGLLANMAASSPGGGVGLILIAIAVGLASAVSAVWMLGKVGVLRLAGGSRSTGAANALIETISGKGGRDSQIFRTENLSAN